MFNFHTNLRLDMYLYAWWWSVRRTETRGIIDKEIQRDYVRRQHFKEYFT
jgi:hypothetical protein